jgi:hypothetical protein
MRPTPTWRESTPRGVWLRLKGAWQGWRLGLPARLALRLCLGPWLPPPGNATWREVEEHVAGLVSFVTLVNNSRAVRWPRVSPYTRARRPESEEA